MPVVNPAVCPSTVHSLTTILCDAVSLYLVERLR